MPEEEGKEGHIRVRKAVGKTPPRETGARHWRRRGSVPLGWAGLGLPPHPPSQGSHGAQAQGIARGEYSGGPVV